MGRGKPCKCRVEGVDGLIQGLPTKRLPPILPLPAKMPSVLDDDRFLLTFYPSVSSQEDRMLIFSSLRVCEPIPTPGRVPFGLTSSTPGLLGRLSDGRTSPRSDHVPSWRG